MTAFLIDEMFPTASAALLRDTYGHNASHVAEAGLRGADDAQVAAVARAEGRAVVTENVADFVAERDVALVFVLKKNLSAGGGQAADPYLGPHWPPTQKSADLADHKSSGQDFPGMFHEKGSVGLDVLSTAISVGNTT